MSSELDIVWHSTSFSVDLVADMCSRLLARNPTVFDRCRKELLDLCSPGSRITRQQLERMKYVNAVLKEGLSFR